MLVQPVSIVANQLARLFDVVNGERPRKQLETLFVSLAIASFVVHLLAILLVRLLPDSLIGPLANVGTNFLSAVYTPFSFILFYEVLLMVLAIPESLTKSIGKQYEILSLIIIRRVFKDIGNFQDLDSWLEQSEAVRIVLLDMAGALLMFVALAGFYRIRKLVIKSEQQTNIGDFILYKKALALVLGAVLIALAAFNLVWWVGSEMLHLQSIFPVMPDWDEFFFPAFFEFMIFTDVLLLVISIAYYDRYEYLFRNSGFVISTVLLRVSLSTDKPYDLAVALIAILYGVLLISVFAYFRWIAEKVTESTSP